MKRNILNKIGDLFLEKPDISDHSAAAEAIQKYFKRLRVSLICGLMVCFMVPHAVLSAYFHSQFTSTLRKSGRLNLMALSESQRNTIDLFLQERVINLFSLFHRRDFSLTPTKQELSSYLQSLRQVSDAFVDVGFLNKEGIQIGYSGPYPFLQGRNYQYTAWFNKLKQGPKEYIISDIYLGFRNKPHFTIAVKQTIDSAPYMVRATLDPDKFYMFLRTMSHGKEVDSALINAEGSYQIVDPGQGKLLEKSDYVPSINEKVGVEEIEIEGDEVMMAYAWLQEADWALLVRQPLKIIHEQMYQARSVMWLSLLLILLIIGVLIVMTTVSLVNHAESIALKSQELQSQLVHASKLASIGELATGVAHEINNPLAIILATSGVIRDKLDPEFELDANPQDMLKDLAAIDKAAFRASRITGQLLDFGRKGKPTFVPSDINQILDDVMEGLMEYELRVDNVNVERTLADDLPEILVDPDQIKQVFVNLINNASDAIDDSGTISISTKQKENHILVTVKDTGRGISQEEIPKIFDPFYTTKGVGKGTGLGLSVSLGIVEGMGGKIEVQSMVGSGSSFTVYLPITNRWSEKKGQANGEWDGEGSKIQNQEHHQPSNRG